jgi:hypothetical protein
MSCCGNRRTAFKIAPLRARPPSTPVAHEASTSLRLEYNGPVPMLLAGAVSRRVYELYTSHMLVDVDLRDETALRATGWFASVS